eukprot:144641_1
MELIREATINTEEYTKNEEQKGLDTNMGMNNDIGKVIELSHIENGTGITGWTSTTKNPDYKLVQINASNIGYQAKCDERFGSYLLYGFCNKMKDNIVKKQNKTLGEIFDSIQNELHDLGKQQTTNIYYNNTRDLRLAVN